jgi:hypothetical protein
MKGDPSAWSRCPPSEFTGAATHASGSPADGSKPTSALTTTKMTITEAATPKKDRTAISFIVRSHIVGRISTHTRKWAKPVYSLVACERILPFLLFHNDSIKHFKSCKIKLTE